MKLAKRLTKIVRIDETQKRTHKFYSFVGLQMNLLNVTKLIVSDIRTQCIPILELNLSDEHTRQIDGFKFINCHIKLSFDLICNWHVLVFDYQRGCGKKRCPNILCARKTVFTNLGLSVGKHITNKYSMWRQPNTNISWFRTKKKSFKFFFAVLMLSAGTGAGIRVPIFFYLEFNSTWSRIQLASF